jgi:hypothetical protein
MKRGVHVFIPAMFAPRYGVKLLLFRDWTYGYGTRTTAKVPRTLLKVLSTCRCYYGLGIALSRTNPPPRSSDPAIAIPILIFHWYTGTVFIIPPTKIHT